MNKDLELQQQFAQKNLEILKNKLNLDIDHNMEALTLSLNHILELEVSSAFLKIITIYHDAGDASVQESDIRYFLIPLGEVFLEEMKRHLMGKRKEYHLQLEKDMSSFTIDDYLHLLDFDEDYFDLTLRNRLNQFVEEEVISKFQQLTKQLLDPEKRAFVDQRILSFLQDHFLRRLLDKTKEQVFIRNQTLKNNAKANFEHYLILPN